MNIFNLFFCIMLIVVLFAVANSQTIIYGDGTYPKWFARALPSSAPGSVYIRYD